MFKKAILSFAALVVSCGMAFAQYNPNTFVAPKGIDLRSHPYSELNYVTPQMFGAVCNAVTDDKVALQAAEDAAYTNKSAVAYIGPNLCRTTVSLIPKPGVDHFCFSGMNFANSATQQPCGILNQGGAWAFDFASLVWGGVNAGVMAPTFHDMLINSDHGGIRIGNTGLQAAQAVASYFKVDHVTISSAATYDAIQANLCFYCTVNSNWFITPVIFYMSDYVSVTNNSSQNSFTMDNRPMIQFLSDSTYGNSNVADHNFIECPTAGGTSCIKTNARTGTISNNGFECPSAGLPTVIEISAPTSQGSFATTINNNDIVCTSSQATHWLTVGTVPALYSLVATNNHCTCTFSNALFRNGASVPQFTNSGLVSQIYHWGNSNEGGFPWNSYNSFPGDPSGTAGGLLFSTTPGNTSYNINYSGSAYAPNVAVLNGAWQLPAVGGGGNVLVYNSVPSSFVGTLDICIKASSTTASQQVKLVSSDNAVPINTTTFTLTANPTWYCYKGHAFTIAATAAVVNDDTVRNGSVQIYQLTISQEL